jgi:hypothetical protein
LARDGGEIAAGGPKVLAWPAPGPMVLAGTGETGQHRPDKKNILRT